MQKVGEILKAEREKKGLSLHEIGMTLKINPKILKAIEDNDSTQLPAKTFLRGFVRSYAQYLRLDANAILTQLQIEIGPVRPEEKLKTLSEESQDEGKEDPAAVPAPTKEPVAAKTEKSRKIPHDSGINGKKILMFAGTTFLIIMIIFVAKMIDKYQKESRRPKIEIEEGLKVVEKDDLTAKNPTEVGTVADVPTEEPLITPIATGTPAKTDTPPIEKIVAATSPTPAHNPMPTSTPVAATPSPVATPSPTPVMTPVPTPTPAPSPSPSPTPTIMKPVEVIIEALNKVEIKYSFDDQKYETISLMADELHTFKSKTGIKLEMSDGGAVSIIVNGRDKGVPGTIGKPIKLSYPK